MTKSKAMQMLPTLPEEKEVSFKYDLTKSLKEQGTFTYTRRKWSHEEIFSSLSFIEKAIKEIIQEST